MHGSTKRKIGVNSLTMTISPKRLGVKLRVKYIIYRIVHLLALIVFVNQIISYKSPRADLGPVSRSHTLKVFRDRRQSSSVSKYCQFLFEYCVSVLAKNVNCLTFSVLLLISCMLGSGII